ncbi:MAG: histidine ammonia-lyase [Phycisphaerales bacterium]
MQHDPPPHAHPTGTHDAVRLTGHTLSTLDVEQVARDGRSVSLHERGLERLERAHAALGHALAGGRPIYGVNTGFGSLARKRVEADELATVQHNLLRSHASGVGEPLPIEVVRAMMLLLAASLTRGHSGVRPALVRLLIDLLNAGVTPVVPSIGSVGASGDLAPLAHLGLVLIGEGEATLGTGERIGGREALDRAGLAPVELGPKEGLALINGTHLMAAQGALLMCDTTRVFDAAVAATAMSIDAARATDRFLDPRVYHARNHWGPARIADRLRHMLAGSEIIPSHTDDDPRVQDPYSLRCAAYVLGSTLQTLDAIREAVSAELGAVTDNPLVFPHDSEHPEPDVISAGNFHGMPVALPLDHLALALTHIAGISERRVYLLLAGADPENPLHPHLSVKPGVESGLMITQYTAAACVNEMITLSAPATVANIPTCAGMEDYNSFGPRAAAKARQALERCCDVVAIELLVAAEALEYQRPLKSGGGVERAHRVIRERVPKLTTDRTPAPDIRAIRELVFAGRFR